jgi:retinol-binding protein 3
MMLEVLTQPMRTTRVHISMLRKLLLLLLMCVCAGVAGAQTTIPDTPAGRVLTAWFDAFNSGDRAKIEAYVKTYDPQNSADGMMGFRGQTGGFDLLAVESSEPLAIKFRVKEKASATVAIGSLQVKAGPPPTVDTFGLRAIPPGAVVENTPLDAATRQKVLDGVASNLKEFYVYPENAQKMVDALHSHQSAGDYDKVTDGDAFATLLTRNLRDVSHDGHLRVNYAPFKAPPDRDEPSADERAQFRKEMERDNCGFRKVEILPGNVGYLKFDMFADPDVCGPTVAAAMGFLAHVDAIILDIRENGGGDPAMVAFIASYLFDKPTHLNDLYDRKEDKTTQYWTLPYVPGSRLAGALAFVLTAKRTFSGAEEFTYDLKTQKRATIIGETTGGGAHPVSGHRVDDHFVIGVPFARAINPITKIDWEGTGVTPDVPVAATDALETAKKLAAEKVEAGKKDLDAKAPVK